MKQKLKELSKYCCEPNSEAEFLAVKLAAEKSGIDWFEGNEYNDEYPYIVLDIEDLELVDYLNSRDHKEISVHEFCEILMKDESEFDRRVDLDTGCNFSVSNDVKSFIAHKGYHWEVNGKEVSLVRN
jgi:hypothetical protein